MGDVGLSNAPLVASAAISLWEACAGHRSRVWQLAPAPAASLSHNTCLVVVVVVRKQKNEMDVAEGLIQDLVSVLLLLLLLLLVWLNADTHLHLALRFDAL